MVDETHQIQAKRLPFEKRSVYAAEVKVFLLQQSVKHFPGYHAA